MSDPQGMPGIKRPRRAEPLQPDRPGRGGRVEPPAGEGAGSSTDGDEHFEKMKQQSDQAVENTSKGYD